MLRAERFDEMLRLLEPASVRAYARAKGWRALDAGFDDIAVLGAPDGGLAQLIVPRRTTLVDHLDLMRRAVERLAEYEGRSADALFDDLSAYHADVLALRITSGRTGSGFLPLTDAANIISGARRALQAAAHSVLSPSLVHHPRLSRSEVEDFIRYCEMGQTGIGSYVLSIRCRDASAQASLEDERPLSRRAVEMLHRSVDLLVHAVEEDQLESLNQAEDSPRITDNLCDAILKMQPEDPSAALTWSVRWDARYEVPADLGRRIEMRRYHFEGIEAIYQELRRREEGDEQRYDARVDELKGDTDEGGRRSGLVVLTVLLDEEVVKANVMLAADDYDKAIEAHRTSSLVTIRGRLHRLRRAGRIEDPRQFELIREPSLAS